MTKSEKLSLVLRRTSFTIRERLRPEMDMFHFDVDLCQFTIARFSLAVSSFLRGFFRLIQFTYFQ